MIVKRQFVQLRTTYLLREDDGSYLRSLTFRDVMTLVAAEQGRVRARRRRCHAPYFYDEFLHPECDDYGIGYGTISGLQGGFKRAPLIEPCGTEEGPLGLTTEGIAILAEIRALVGEAVA